MRWTRTAASLCALAVLMAGCSASKAKSGSSGGKAVNNGTFTLAQAADPGNLDPQQTVSSSTLPVVQFVYDNLLSITKDGHIQSQLATKWQVEGTKVVLTIKPGITCSDGAAFTATDVVDNLDYVADPKNKSPLLGLFLPVGAKSNADKAAGTVTITLVKPAPFVLNGLATLPMVCAKGRADRKSLARQPDGTGPYKLTEAASSDHYTFTKRAGYKWGPDGASTDTPGLPSKVIVKIVPNETTAANLLLSGGINAAGVLGPDAQRLQAAKLFSVGATSITGEMWFNQGSGHPGADKAVRQAMTSALDLAQEAKVLTSGKGTAGTTFAAVPPVACAGNSIASSLPPHGLDKAKAMLDSAGWTAGPGGVRAKAGKSLAMTFLNNTDLGAPGSAAGELAAQAWKQLGVKVTTKAQNSTAINTTILSQGTWDVGWIGLNVSTPDQLVTFISGPTPPNGTNFAHINNPAYTALVNKAAQRVGVQGCPDWLAAESNLVKEADVIPFANQVTRIFGKKAKFELTSFLVPTSIRVLAQ